MSWFLEVFKVKNQDCPDKIQDEMHNSLNYMDTANENLVTHQLRIFRNNFTHKFVYSQVHNKQEGSN